MLTSSVDLRRQIILLVETETAGLCSFESFIAEDSFVFEEKGKSTLRLHPRQDGGLSATWVAADGKTSMTAHLNPIDPQSLARRVPSKGSAPVAATAAHGDSNEAEE